MKCHYCGAEVAGNEIYCRNCGTRQMPAPKEEPVVIAAPVYEAPAAPVQEPVAVAAPEELAPAVHPEPEYKEKTFGWQPYGGAPAPAEPLFDFEKAAAPRAPKNQLPTRRGLGKMIIFSILTLGIYPMVIWSRLVGEVNMVASRYDGERSMSFFGMLLLSPVTLGIHSLVWMHKLCRRIGTELQRRNINSTFGARDFWLWNVLLGMLASVLTGIGTGLAASGFDVQVVLWILICVGILAMIGPFVFLHKLMKAMNQLNENYNVNG